MRSRAAVFAVVAVVAELESQDYVFGSGHALTAVYATNDYLSSTDERVLLVANLCPDCWVGGRRAAPIILDGP